MKVQIFYLCKHTVLHQSLRCQMVISFPLLLSTGVIMVWIQKDIRKILLMDLCSILQISFSETPKAIFAGCNSQDSLAIFLWILPKVWTRKWAIGKKGNSGNTWYLPQTSFICIIFSLIEAVTIPDTVSDGADNQAAFEEEIDWFLSSVCSSKPVPLKDGSASVEKDIVIAVKSARNSIWFARVLEVTGEDLTVQYFDKCKPTNNQKYFLIPDSKEHISKNMVICSGVPLQPQIFHRMENGTVTWKSVLPYSCYQSLSQSDQDMTNYEHKIYSLCNHSLLIYGLLKLLTDIP